MHQLLVEIGAQPGQFIGIAQFGCGDLFVKALRPRLVLELRGQIAERAVGPHRHHPVFALVAGITVGIIEAVVGLLALFAFLLVGVGGFAALFDLALTLAAGVVALIAVVLLLVVLALILIAAVIGFFGQQIALDQVKILEQLHRQIGKGRLIVDREAQRVEVAAALFLDPVAHQREARRRAGRRFAPAQPLAHDQANRG